MSGRPKGWGIARRGRERRRAAIWEMVRRLVRGESGAAVGAYPRTDVVMDWLTQRGIYPDRRVTPVMDHREMYGLQYLLLLPGWVHGGVGEYLRGVAGPMTRSGLGRLEIARCVIGGGYGTQVWTGKDVDDVLGFEERRPTHEEMVTWNASDGDFRERAERMLKRSRSGATTLVPPPVGW